jgi:hypothetical protein
MFGLFAKAAAGASLSPAARAALKFVEGIGAAAFVSALPVVAQMLASQLNAGAVNWTATGQTALACVVMAFLLALAKYYKSHGDAPLASVAQQAADSFAKYAALPNDVVAELEASGLPNTADAGALGAASVLPTSGPLTGDATASSDAPAIVPVVADAAVVAHG